MLVSSFVPIVVLNVAAVVTMGVYYATGKNPRNDTRHKVDLKGGITEQPEDEFQDGNTQNWSQDGNKQNRSQDRNKQNRSQDGNTQNGSQNGDTENRSQDGNTQNGSQDGNTQNGSQDGNTQNGSQNSDTATAAPVVVPGSTSNGGGVTAGGRGHHGSRDAQGLDHHRRGKLRSGSKPPTRRGLHVPPR